MVEAIYEKNVKNVLKPKPSEFHSFLVSLLPAFRFAFFFSPSRPLDSFLEEGRTVISPTKSK